LFIKTKNFHWHVQGPRFRDLHLLFDEQAQEIIGVTDAIAERVRKNGGTTLTSIGTIAKHTQIADQDRTGFDPQEMVRELRDDNRTLVDQIRAVKAEAEKAGDNATDGLSDDWTDMAEERAWFLDSIAA
jgi:starvation-inducible DNA-binding protein